MSEIFKSCKSSREMTHLEGADKMGSQWQSHSRPERLRSFRSATKKLKNIAGGIVAFGQGGEFTQTIRMTVTRTSAKKV